MSFSLFNDILIFVTLTHLMLCPCGTLPCKDTGLIHPGDCLSEKPLQGTDAAEAFLPLSQRDTASIGLLKLLSLLEEREQVVTQL